jgi:hypothetical protein
LGSLAGRLIPASVEAGGTRLGWLRFLNKRENDIGKVQKAFTRETEIRCQAAITGGVARVGMLRMSLR